MKNDIEIQNDVMEEIKWDPMLNAAEIGVSVKNGVVTLSGMVDTYSRKMAAESAARKVSGVRAVAENIQVGVSPAFRKTDAELAEAVLNALKWNTTVPEEKIKIKVEDGVVRMEGQVDWEYQRSAIKAAVGNLAGVRGIINLIMIKPVVTPANVKQKINAAFHRSARIDADKITVEVIDNRVILNGRVRSFSEKDDAVNAAWSAPGISAVESRLIVEEEELAF